MTHSEFVYIFYCCIQKNICTVLTLKIRSDSFLRVKPKIVICPDQTPYLIVETGIPTPIVEATTQDLI